MTHHNHNNMHNQQRREHADPFQKNYRPTKPAPDFEHPNAIHNDPTMTVERFQAWSDSIPESPVPRGVRLAVQATFATMRDRIAMGNRTAAYFATRLGITTADEAEVAKILESLRTEFDRITFGTAAATDAKVRGKRAKMTKLPTDAADALLSARNFNHADSDLLTSYAEYVTVHTFLAQHAREKQQFAQLAPIMDGIPVYDEFLSKVRGMGPMASASLLAFLNPYAAPSASSFVRYMGLDLGPDGRGRGIRMTHMEPRYYLARAGRDAEPTLEVKSSRTYNAIAKSRLLFIGMAGMIKAAVRWAPATDSQYDNAAPSMRRIKDLEATDDSGAKIRDDKGKVVMVPTKQICLCDCEFAKAYMDYKHRLAHSSEIHTGEGKAWKDCAPAHRNMAAIRYMGKLFLVVLWKVWRKLEGLPIRDTFAVEKLGQRSHHVTSVWARVGDNVGVATGAPVADLPVVIDGVDFSSLGD